MRSRAVKFQPYFESGFPYDGDQWISQMATGGVTSKTWRLNSVVSALPHWSVTMNSIVVTDAKVANITCAQTSLAAGAETQCVGNQYTITDADVTALEVVNTATATGLSANGLRASDLSDDPSDLANVDVNGDGDPDDATVLVLAPPPVGNVTMQKTTSVSTAKSGDVIVYTLMLTNSQAFAAGPFSVVDTLPQGFTFVDGSATSAGTAVTPQVAGH